MCLLFSALSSIFLAATSSSMWAFFSFHLGRMEPAKREILAARESVKIMRHTRRDLRSYNSIARWNSRVPVNPTYDLIVFWRQNIIICIVEINDRLRAIFLQKDTRKKYINVNMIMICNNVFWSFLKRSSQYVTLYSLICIINEFIVIIYLH